MSGNGQKPPIADWRSTNVIYERMSTLQMRTREVIEGKIPLLIVYGPPGISKSKSIMYELNELYNREYQKWKEADPKPARRTAKKDDGKLVFNEPYRIVTGEISFPIFYCRMFWASRPGEVLFIDDVTSLSDRRIQSCLHQGSDPTHNGTVRFGFKTAPPDELVPRRYSFRGGIIICTNFRKSDSEEALKLKQLFTPAVRDRAEEVDFEWNENALFEYVSKLAFGRDPEAGLYQYMLAESWEQNPDENRGRDDVGLGFKGSCPEKRHEEAIAIQREVFEVFKASRERIPEGQMSFRTLRKWMRDRINHPVEQRDDKGRLICKDWRGLIEEKLLPPVQKAATSEASKGGKGGHAYEERPMR